MPTDENERNQAAWLTLPKGYPLEVLGADFPSNVKPDHVIIRVRAISINPVDAQMQEHDIFQSRYPCILGCEVSGSIFDVSETIPATRFKEGDRVLAECNAIGSGDVAEGAFQRYVSCHADLVSKIPERMNFDEASTLPLAITTAAQGLYGKEYLRLPYPTLDPPEVSRTEEKWVLIWGGDSSVAVQLAAASYVNVIATASKRHHNWIGALGANAVFDHSAADVDQQILNLINNRNFFGVFDAVGTPEARASINSILEQLGGGVVASVLSPPDKGPNNTRTKVIMASRIIQGDPEVAKAIFRDFLPNALNKGVVKPAPPAHVIGKGLDKIQSGIDKVKNGVTGQKMVVEID